MKKYLIVFLLFAMVGCSGEFSKGDELSAEDSKFLNDVSNAEESSEVIDLVTEGYGDLKNDDVKQEVLEIYNKSVLDFVNNTTTDILFNIFFSNYNAEIKEELRKYMNKDAERKVMERLNPVKLLLDEKELKMKLLDVYKGIRNNRNIQHIHEKLENDNINYKVDIKENIIIIDNEVVVEFNGPTSRRIYQIKDENDKIISSDKLFEEISSIIDQESEINEVLEDNQTEELIKIKEKQKIIKIGMTDEEVLEKWGEPKTINRTISDNYVKEQWVYSNKYLYFENGILKTIQE